MATARAFSSTQLNESLNFILKQVDEKPYQYSDNTTNLNHIGTEAVAARISIINEEYRNSTLEWENNVNAFIKQLTNTQLYNLCYYFMCIDSNNNLMIPRSSSRITNCLYQACYKAFGSKFTSAEMISLNKRIFQSLHGKGIPAMVNLVDAAANAISFSLGLGTKATPAVREEIDSSLDHPTTQTTRRAIREYKLPQDAQEQRLATSEITTSIEQLSALQNNLTNEVKSKSFFFKSSIPLKGAKIAFINDLLQELKTIQKKNYNRTTQNMMVTGAIAKIIKKDCYKLRGITLDTVVQGRISHRTRDLLSSAIGGNDRLNELRATLRKPR